jgi:hypothetical protein
MLGFVGRMFLIKGINVNRGRLSNAVALADVV